MKGYLANSEVRHDGVQYKKGDFINAEVLDEQSTKRLLFLNAISKAFKEDDIIPDQSDADIIPPNADDSETVEETLDINFDLDELKAGAKECGLTFAAKLGKAKLIALIVENGKQDYFLDQLED